MACALSCDCDVLATAATVSCLSFFFYVAFFPLPPGVPMLPLLGACACACSLLPHLRPRGRDTPAPAATVGHCLFFKSLFFDPTGSSHTCSSAMATRWAGW